MSNYFKAYIPIGRAEGIEQSGVKSEVSATCESHLLNDTKHKRTLANNLSSGE